jgi:anti-sigma B factor antagonist
MRIIEDQDIYILKWNQDVTLKNVDEFRMEIWKLVENSGNKLILDLSGVNYLNSASLGVIADAVQYSKRYHKQLVISGVQPMVEEKFKIIRFGSFMKIFGSLKEAYHFYTNAAP